MIGLTGGHICPLCGYKLPVQTITYTTGTEKYGEYVEVIRCQDCKYCDAMTIFGKTTLYACTRKNPAVDVLPSDYCSKGRRKDES